MVALALPPPLDPAEASGTAAPCCFSNPTYVGVCSVVPAPDEACADILRYLNTPNTAGKTYCGSTRIRGGWKHIPCPPKKVASLLEQRSACADDRRMAVLTRNGGNHDEE